MLQQVSVVTLLCVVMVMLVEDMRIIIMSKHILFSEEHTACVWTNVDLGSGFVLRWMLNVLNCDGRKRKAQRRKDGRQMKRKFWGWDEGRRRGTDTRRVTTVLTETDVSKSHSLMRHMATFHLSSCTHMLLHISTRTHSACVYTEYSLLTVFVCYVSYAHWKQ